ncbi:MAG: glutaminase [Crocosphaera sp.]|nr:glutaminase [Crocosphaera sp.]
MKSLNNLTSKQLYQWLNEASKQAINGKLPTYIPLLQNIDPRLLAISVITKDNNIISAGDTNITLALMSIIKPFFLLYLLSELEEALVFKKVGNLSSNYPFNSLEQLQLDDGFPRNPMINSGALTLASLLPGKDSQTRCNILQQWLNKTGKCNLFLDQLMLKSVRSLPNINNQKIIEKLTKINHINEPEITLDTYNKICCLSGTIIDLARLGLLLVKSSHISEKNTFIVREIMNSCGLYEESEKFAQKIGFPSKSGVSGAILSIVPEQGAIACYSPPLDNQGNSVASLFILEKIANYLNN